MSAEELPQAQKPNMRSVVKFDVRRRPLSQAQQVTERVTRTDGSAARGKWEATYSGGGGAAYSARPSGVKLL